MNVGLKDVDGHNFPNLPLMKLSAWHKRQGDSVEWYEPLVHGFPNQPLDRVYLSKVFSFTPDFPYDVNAKEVIKGGSGYAIKTQGRQEIYEKEKDVPLPHEIEHIYPDYSLYPGLAKDTAFGFLTRGCPRGCSFCHVKEKEGQQAYKAADLSEFWKGQKNIVLCDPNLIACPEWESLIWQLVDSKASVDINQGIDIRLMTEKKAELIKRMKVKSVHFAWDRYEDKGAILPKLEYFKAVTGWDKRKMTVYVLTNYDTTVEQDLERIYTLRDLGYSPYVMVYGKENTKSTDTARQVQRWVNNRKIFASVKTFGEYNKRNI